MCKGMAYRQWFSNGCHLKALDEVICNSLFCLDEKKMVKTIKDTDVNTL